MDLPRVEITTTPGKIGINQSRAKTEINQPQADLEVSQPQGDLNIETELVEINVDNYPSQYDMGFRNISDMLSDIKNKGQQQAAAAITQYAGEGDQLMRYQQFKISDLAQAKSRPEEKNLTLKYKRLPDIKVKPNSININYQANPPVIKAQPRYPQTQAQWGQIDTYLMQKPDIEIEVAGKNINRKV